MKDVEIEETQIKQEITVYEKDLQTVTEMNVRENVTLEYETNKNWINFRDKKKQLETKSKEIQIKLNQSEEQYKKVAMLFEEKSNQSYNYFDQKHTSLINKKDGVT